MLPLGSALTRILHDAGGAAATIVVIALPVLLGFGALGVETGVWFTFKLRNQSAADAAAIAAAYGVLAGKADVIDELTPAASEAATRNGYKGSSPSVIYPYFDMAGSNGVAVTLHQTLETVLASMFLTQVSVSARAVAVIEVLDSSCILALGGSGTGLKVQPGAHLHMPGCSAVANSTGASAIALSDSTSSISAATLVTAGEISLQGTPIDPIAPPSQFALVTPAMIGAPSVADPYASALTHSFLTSGMPTAANCTSNAAAGQTTYGRDCVVAATSLTAASIKLTGNTQISGSWTISTGQTVDLAPGTYWVTGNLTVASNGVLKCSACDNMAGIGATIVLTTTGNKIGAMSVAANAVLSLNPPSSGRFAGLALVQDSNGLPPGTSYTARHSKIIAGPSATLDGLIYFPNSSLTFHGNASATGPRCLVLVADSVIVNATSSLDTRGCASAGLISLPTVNTVALAE